APAPPPRRGRRRGSVRPPADARGRGPPPRPAREAARRREGVQECEAQGGGDRGSTEVALDALEDRPKGDELARRVQVEQGVDEAAVVVGQREAIAKLRPHLVG